MEPKECPRVPQENPGNAPWALGYPNDHLDISVGENMIADKWGELIGFILTIKDGLNADQYVSLIPGHQSNFFCFWS